MSIWFKLKFQLLKMIRMCWYMLRYSFYKWRKIEGVYIPVKMSYGYSVLRFIDNGQYEQCEISIIKNTLKKEDVVLELGTGVGFVSTYCARQISDANVYTYEANSLLKQTIETVYKKNDVHPKVTFAMLGERQEPGKFYRDTKSFLASSAKKTAQNLPTGMEITILPLNEIIKKVKPTYLIMDIEGGEYDIFNIIDFQSIKKIQFELHPDVLGNEQVQTIFNQLQHNNFSRDTSFKFDNNFYFYRN